MEFVGAMSASTKSLLILKSGACPPIASVNLVLRSTPSIHCPFDSVGPRVS